jgi:heavy metal translocating P-type ATPase
MQGAAHSRRLALLTLGGLLAGGAAWLAGAGGVARAAWALTTAAMLVPLALGVAKSLLRREVGVDLIALLAMAGALAIGEYLAGAVVALMLAGGQALEAFAGARARSELSALLGRVPRTAHRYQDGGLVSLPVAEIGAGDRLLVKPGEIVPVDGVTAGTGTVAVLDESALTGESRPVERLEGDAVKSGTVNAGGPFDLRAVATAAASTYAGIVRLVEQAQASKAPFVRLADRYALVFLPLTLLVAAAAWIAGGSPLRAVAVLVVATPCPLILAAPVALIAGVSACARRGIIVKGSGALEALAVGRVLLLDKTGTLTTGVPELAAIEAFGGPGPGADELLRLAASLDQVSPHVFAAALVRGARERGLPLSFPAAVEERLGAGIRGTVERREVALGRLDWVAAGRAVPPRAREIRLRAAREGASNVFVAVDGAVAGALILRDPVRADTPETLRALRQQGIRRVVMVTGDAAEVAEPVAAAIGADRLLAECTPEEKVAAVRAERARGPTIMVGDGVNDAPALAAADLGVAMGARGATASSEAADVVITLDRLDRVAEALAIARRARRIALESVLAGMGLSLVAMLAAAAGYLPPVAGALLQEAIDVAVIVNALRALAAGRRRPGSHPGGWRRAHLPLPPSPPARGLPRELGGR